MVDHLKCVTTDHRLPRQVPPITDDQLTSNAPPPHGGTSHSVIAVSFDDDRSAYNALTLLQGTRLPTARRRGEAVVVVRGEDGHLVEKDRIKSTFLPATTGGGLIGLLLGISADRSECSSAGRLDSWSARCWAWPMEETDLALGATSGAVKVGGTELLAVVLEQRPEVVDAAMSGVGGTVWRRPVVEAEIATAEDAERKAKREARKELVRARREHDRAAVNR